ncbi:hypothetical protein Hbl1158_14515 [Halobaculum sp. CBA1158]|uniref:helix-turn-helix transcriptional regulator n=1 Tax=Halobaculum sp. CBA1158 TaxID=2904243 RepID=UPI001F380208|nr:hypothetical protein [Halobaculum sp. CBA1158]UIO99717.1 hypothetical protein Hbl1158_14515 [Halobaculum sp. CBA1158]
MRRPAAAAALALVLALAAVAPAVGAAGSASASSAPLPTSYGTLGSDATAADIGLGAAQTGDVEANRVVLRATLEPDGDARWEIAYRIELTDDNTTAAFESLREDIRANRSAYTAQFASRMNATVAAAENATGREMAARNVSVATGRDPFPTSSDYGVVTYSFTWEGFAATQGDRVVAGDALAGLYLDAGTVLTIAWPDDLDARSVDPEADERSDTAVTWRGERNFGPGQPRVTVAPASALPVRPAYLAAAAVVLLGVAGAVVLRRRGAFPVGGDSEAVAGDGSLGSDSGAASAPETARSTASETDRRDHDDGEGGDDGDDSASERSDAPTAAGDPSGSAGDDSEAAGGGDDATPPEELLSPHERVTRLVAGNGGRMKQADVTEELGWSAARTSQVVGDLRDDGDLESFRLGRENVLRLPEADDEPHPGEPDRPGDGDDE